MGEIASLLPLIQGVSSAAGGYAQNNASVAQGRFTRNAGNMNAQIAMQQAGDVNAAGEIAASRRLKQGALDASSEKARLASEGVNPNTGSAAAVGTDVRAAAGEDAATIRHNAALQAWGLGTEAVNYNTHGNMGYIAGRNEGTQSLIQGGLGFANGLATSGYLYDKNKKPSIGMDYTEQNKLKNTKDKWKGLD